jgi:hypothetical protein
MYQGDENALQAICGGFDSHSFHKLKSWLEWFRSDLQPLKKLLSREISSVWLEHPT